MDLTGLESNQTRALWPRAHLSVPPFPLIQMSYSTGHYASLDSLPPQPGLGCRPGHLPHAPSSPACVTTVARPPHFPLLFSTSACKVLCIPFLLLHVCDRIFPQKTSRESSNPAGEHLWLLLSTRARRPSPKIGKSLPPLPPSR
jgi:hypothetical protein